MAPPRVELREVTRDNLVPVLRLRVSEEQTRLVASNAVSIAEAHFEPLAWFRAIHADDSLVGFVMLSLDEEAGEYGVWRLMIDAAHQRRGYGRAALERVVEHVRGLPGARELLVSHVQREGHPGPFYASLGFVYTGAEDDGELVMRLPL